MLVSVTVRKEFHPGAVVVPRTAVFQTENGANVFTVVDMPAPPAGAPGRRRRRGGRRPRRAALPEAAAARAAPGRPRQDRRSS